MTDQEFALKVADEFKIPLQDLTKFISDLRTWKELKGQKKDFPSVKRKTEADFCRIIDDPNFNVITIHIETNDDVIHLSEDDPLFYYFNTSIKRMKQAFQKEMITADKQWRKQINTQLERDIFRHFIFYFRNHNLLLFSQRAIIGLFLLHFEIYFRDPIMTEEQWENNKKGLTYYRYLNNIVKHKHNKYLKELSPQK
jgi:hypothetical protein